MFNRINIFIPLFFCIVIMSCANETTKEHATDSTTNLEQLESRDIEIENQDAELEQASIRNENQINKDIPKPEEIKAVIKKAEKLEKENIAKSENKGKTCDEIIQELDALVDAIVKDKTNKDLMSKLAKWNTDVLHNNCRKDSAYEAAFLKTISKLN